MENAHLYCSCLKTPDLVNQVLPHHVVFTSVPSHQGMSSSVSIIISLPLTSWYDVLKSHRHGMSFPCVTPYHVLPLCPIVAWFPLRLYNGKRVKLFLMILGAELKSVSHAHYNIPTCSAHVRKSATQSSHDL